METFEGLSLTDRQKKVFSKVYVNRVILSKQAGIVTVYLESDHIIPFREIGLLEYALKQEFAKTKFSAAVREHFTLPGSYTPEAFWREYSESVLLLLKERNVLLFNMLYRGEVSFEGSLMRIACEDELLFRAREQELKEYIQEIFLGKAGLSIDIQVSFSLESQSREPEGYEVFRRNEQGYYTCSRVKDFYENAPLTHRPDVCRRREKRRRHRGRRKLRLRLFERARAACNQVVRSVLRHRGIVCTHILSQLD